MLSRSTGLEVASLGMGSWVSPVSRGAVLVGINIFQPCLSGILSAAEQPHTRLSPLCCACSFSEAQAGVRKEAAAYEWAEDSAVSL